MAIRDNDTGFVWDALKRSITHEKHNIELVEVVRAMEDPSGITDPEQSSDGSERWLGVTDQRLLCVVFALVDDIPELYRIITAFEASEEQREQYHYR